MSHTGHVKNVHAHAAQRLKKLSSDYVTRLQRVSGLRPVLSVVGDEKSGLYDTLWEKHLDQLDPVSRNLVPGNHVALKDNLATTDLPTTCASYILQGFRPPRNSTVTQILEDAGIKVVAKTNMDEFAMGSHSVHSAYGAVRNGYGSYQQSVGGSSGGSALAVAAHMIRIAIGSDTGGSVRLPAAYTGIVGFKPSYGRISRYGLIPYANSLDTVGLMALSVRDIISLYRLLNKYDPLDPTCLSLETRTRIDHALLRRRPKSRHTADHPVSIRAIGQADDSFESHVPSSQAVARYFRLSQPYSLTKNHPFKIGVPIEYNIAEMHPFVHQAWLRTLSTLSQLGHSLVEISLPTTPQALAAYYVLAPAEASSNLAKYDGVRYGIARDPSLPDDHNGPLYAHYRGQFFGDEVKRRILLGTFSLSAGAMDNYFIQAQKVRRLVQNDFNSVFALRHPLMDDAIAPNNGVDFIVVPTAPTLPPLHSDLAQQSPLDAYVNDIFTVPASLAGLPAISVPVDIDPELPPTPDKNLGIQVIGQFGDDMSVMGFARDVIEAIQPPKAAFSRIWHDTRL